MSEMFTIITQNSLILRADGGWDDNMRGEGGVFLHLCCFQLNFNMLVFVNISLTLHKFVEQIGGKIDPPLKN